MSQSGGYIHNTLIRDLDNNIINNDLALKDLYNSLNRGSKLEKDELIRLLDNYMPIPIFIELLTKLNITNFLLVNQQKYILIDKRNTLTPTRVFTVYDNYQIKETDLLDNTSYFKDNINIHNLSPIIMYSRINYIDKIFLKISKHINNENFPYYNKLLNTFYDGEYYIRKINPILSFIFMNKLHEILNIINRLTLDITGNQTDYYNLKYTKQSIPTIGEVEQSRISYDIKSNNSLHMCDYLTSITNQKIIDTIDKINYNLLLIFNKKKKELPQLDYNPENYNLLLKIINIVINYINTYPNLVEGYNYAIYIKTYKELNQNLTRNIGETGEEYESRKRAYDKGKQIIMEKFINTPKEQIKQTLIFELSYFLYLAYKTNEESGDFNYKIAQYTILDYFYGVTKDEIPKLPINKRQTIMNIRRGVDDNSSYKLIKDDEWRGVPLHIIPYTAELYGGDAELDKLFYSCVSDYNDYIIIQSQTIYTDEHGAEYEYIDCGETTLLNLFNYILLQPSGSFDISKLSDEKIIAFYTRYPTINSIITENLQTLKNEWGKVIQDRPSLIIRDMYQNEKYNFRPSLFNTTLLCNLFHNNSNKELSLVEIILYLNPYIKSNKISLISKIIYDTITINNELYLKFSELHAESMLISKFNKIYEELDHRFNEKLIINHPYTTINIHLLYKIAYGTFDITKCNEYNLMNYLCKYYFTNDSKKIEDRTKYNLMKYITFEHIEVYKSVIIINDDKILDFIYNELVKTNSIDGICEFIIQSYYYMVENDIIYIKYPEQYPTYNFPVNLLKKIYDYKIDDKRFVEFNLDDYLVNEDQSYIIDYYNNKIRDNLTEINKKIPRVIELLNMSEVYRARIVARSKIIRIQNRIDDKDLQEEENESDKENDEPNMDLLGGAYLLKNSILKIIDDYIEDTRINELNKNEMTDISKQIYKLLEDNNEIKNKLEEIKLFLMRHIQKYYIYLID